MYKRNDMDTRISMLEGIIPYSHKLAPLFIRNTLYSLIPEGIEHIYVVGIGSNLINGDSLGPFVGTLLQDMYPNHLTVLGNLKSPLDATTLVPRFSGIALPNNSFVVAIDSVLGSEGIVNTIVVREGSLRPGIGLGHNLPSIGDCSVMGVVLENDPAVESSLFYTNLHLIYTMATNIAKGISLAIRQYFKYPSDHPILLIS
ncbi:spore protease YyaC [Metabacillus bambusae]|nr:spore protease YyaC [Metabacillus bambusae]